MATVKSIYQLAQEHLQANRFRDALLVINEIGKEHPDYYSALVDKAFILLHLDPQLYADDAFALSAESLAHDQENSEAYLLQGIASDFKQEKKQALVCFDTAIELEKKRNHSHAILWHALYRKGRLLELQGDLGEARQVLQECINLDQKNVKCANALTKVQEKINDQLLGALNAMDTKAIQKYLQQGGTLDEETVVNWIKGYLEKDRRQSMGLKRYLESSYCNDPRDKMYTPLPEDDEVPYVDIEKVLKWFGLSKKYKLEFELNGATKLSSDH